MKRQTILENLYKREREDANREKEREEKGVDCYNDLIANI